MGLILDTKNKACKNSKKELLYRLIRCISTLISWLFYIFSVHPIVDFFIVTQYVFIVVRGVCVCCKGAYPFSSS